MNHDLRVAVKVSRRSRFHFVFCSHEDGNTGIPRFMRELCSNRQWQKMKSHNSNMIFPSIFAFLLRKPTHNKSIPLLLASHDHKQFALNRALLIEIVLNYVGFEVLSVGVMKSSWDITPCSPLEVGRRLGRTRRIHLQGHAEHWLLPASCWFHLGLPFDPEDGGDTFLQNVGLFSTCKKTLHPIRQIFPI
jgi:hypothetical protein